MKAGIAGAGLLGRLLAVELTRRGHEVHVYDPAPDPHARGAAGWTAAGMLSPAAELECADLNVFQLGVRSLQLWAELIPTLPLPVSLSQAGSLLLAHRGDTGAAMRCVQLLQQKAPPDYHPKPIHLNELKALEPDVFGPAHAWLLPQEGHLNTVEAMLALHAAASQAHWHWNTPVDVVAPGELHTSAGRQVFDHVFDVRGLGARPPNHTAADAGIHCRNVRGVRGEIFWVQAPHVTTHRPIRLLHPRHRVYIVPRRDHIFVIGASEIESEDRSPVSVRSTVELLAAAHSVVPGLAEGRLVHTETNLRPALVDNLPRTESEPGLTCINGLFRHGWLIAPAIVHDALASDFFVNR
ncbi:MAG: FAD-dependent oxidoreductase [Burkholderiaceae bacterium]